MSNHDHGHEPEQDLDLLADMGYERSDFNLTAPALSKLSIGFLVFIGACFVAAWLVWDVLDRTDYFKASPKPVNAARRQLPKEVPLLQSNATAKKDMEDLRALEETKLNASEWTNESRTVAKIPVESAIELVAKRGMPTRANAGIPSEYVDRASAMNPGPVAQPGGSVEPAAESGGGGH